MNLPRFRPLILSAAVASMIHPHALEAQQAAPRMVEVEGRQVRVMTGGLEHLERFFEVSVQERVAKLSAWTLDAPDGLFAVAKPGRHYVHYDDPELVVHAIRSVVFHDIGGQLRAALAANGSDALADTYRSLKRRYPAGQFSENLLNTPGNELLGEGLVDHSIAVFELNVAEYPDAWNPHDSLGDAYAAAGERGKAMASYRRSLELNPDSPSGPKLEALERGT